MSASQDVQQRDRNFGNFAATNLAVPVNSADAARKAEVDTVAAAAAAAAASAAAALAAAAAALAAAIGTTIDLSDDATHAVTGLTETVVSEWNRDFSVLPAGAVNVIPTLSGLASRTTAGTTGTFNLRVGGTIGAVDGTVVATFTATGALAQKSDTGAAFAKPATAGGDLVKITAVADNALGVATIRGATVSFKGST